jgi:hypothetical protein
MYLLLERGREKILGKKRILVEEKDDINKYEVAEVY